MRNSEERDLREGFYYDPSVRGFDSYFLLGDTADLLADTVRDALKIGDTALVGSVSSIPQFLYGDFEFAMLLDSTVPDSNDSERYFGLRNKGDTLQRGAAYFDLAFDTLTGADTTIIRAFRAVAHDEQGTRQRKNITWDTNWSGGGRLTRFRIQWEADGYRFLVNDTVYATLGDRPDSSNATFSVNTSIPQAIRLSKRSADTTDTSSTALKSLNIRNSRIINWRERL